MAKKTEKAAVAPKRVITKVAKVAKAAKGAAVKTSARHPRARVKDLFAGKAELAKTLAAAVARADEDTDQLETRLKTAHR